MESNSTLVYLSSTAVPSSSASSVHIMKMCRAFCRLGYRTTLVSPNAHPSRVANRNVYAQYGVDPVFRIQYIPYISPRNNKLRYLISTFLYCFQLACFLAVKKPQFVYGRYLPGCLVASLIGIPTFFESHAEIWTRRLEHFLFSLLLRLAAFEKLVVISEALKHRFQQRYVFDKKQIMVAHDGADPLPDDTLPSNWPGRYGCLQVGYVGSIYRGRGMHLIDSLAHAMPDIDFHIVGATKAEFSKTVANSPTTNLIAHGRLPHCEIHRYLNRCDVLLAPYQKSVQVFGGRGDTAEFMSPLKIFEYMASGKAIVASDLTVLHEVLDFQTALLVAPDDRRQWISAIEKLRNPDLRTRLGLAARKRLLECYTWEKRALKILGPAMPARNLHRCHHFRF